MRSWPVICKVGSFLQRRGIALKKVIKNSNLPAASPGSGPVSHELKSVSNWCDSPFKICYSKVLLPNLKLKNEEN